MTHKVFQDVLVVKSDGRFYWRYASAEESRMLDEGRSILPADHYYGPFDSQEAAQRDAETKLKKALDRFKESRIERWRQADWDENQGSER